MPRMEWSGELGTVAVVMRAERLKDVIARGALKPIQMGTHERGYDAGHHHLGPAPRTGRTLDCSELNDGR